MFRSGETGVRLAKAAPSCRASVEVSTSVHLPPAARVLSPPRPQDVNTLPPDRGTEWFSDTSPEAVRRRREEAQAESCGLDALASWRVGEEGGGES